METIAILRNVIAFGFALKLTGLLVACGPGGAADAAQKAGTALEKVSAFVSTVDGPLHQAYDLEQSLCETAPVKTDQDKCLAKVRETWRPIIEGLLDVRQVWCEVKPEACAK